MLRSLPGRGTTRRFLRRTGLVLCAGLLTATGLGTATTATAASAETGSARPLYAPGNKAVQVVDPATGASTATIPLGVRTWDLAVSPDGSTVYATHRFEGTVSVVSTETGTITDTIADIYLPWAVAVSPDGAQIYVAHFAPSGSSYAIAVISAATNTVIADISVSGADAIAFTPDGKRAYVVGYGTNSVTAIDTATQVVTTVIGLPNSGPGNLEVTPDGTAVYVTAYNNNTVQVISTATNTVTATINTGSRPRGMSISPDGTKAYTTLPTEDALAVIDTATNTVSTTIPVGDNPVEVLADPSGNAVYVSNFYPPSVSVIDPATNTVTGTGTLSAATYNLDTAQAPPAVTAISPATGTPAGGSTVTITGTHLSGTSAVSFGTTPAADVSVVDDFTVTATVPAHTAGAVDVTVTTPGGTSATSPGGQYTYLAPPADIDVDLTAQPHLGILVPYLTYTLTARNTGPGTVTSATLTTTLPPGATATHLSPGCTATATTVTCAYGTIADGAAPSKTFRIPLHLLSLGNVQAATTRTTSAPTDPNTANDTASANCTVISIILATCS
ncbi:YncE family protein [Streptomyces bacillaris]|uniref:YncE family protein n=1 Tax=Streptomyces bacillaris TaxID=68179 RepID=UPI00345F56EF